MAREPAPGSYADRDRAARDFAGNLVGILDWFDALRAADRDEPPDPQPPWWTGYITRPDAHHARKMYGAKPCPRSRAEWACDRTRDSIGTLLEAWERITGALLLTAPEQRVVTACRESLRNLKGILDPGQPRSRWRIGVIPEEWHLDEPLPEVWEPRGESRGERQAKEQIAQLEADLATAKGKAQSGLLEQLQSAEVALSKATQRRIKREWAKEAEAREQGLVSREVREQRESDLEDWRSQVIRWRLGESDVRELVEVLMAAPGCIGPGRTRFNDQDELIQTGPVPMTTYLTELIEHIEMFLAMLGKCERSKSGGYMLRDPVVGYQSGIEVAWKRVVVLAQAVTVGLFPPPSMDHRVKFEATGVVASMIRPPNSAKPLVDTMRRLVFMFLWKADRSWVTEIEATEAERVRAIASELLVHRARWAKAEGQDVPPQPLPSIRDLQPLLESLVARAVTPAPSGSSTTRSKRAAKARSKMGRPRLDAREQKRRRDFAKEWEQDSKDGRKLEDTCAAWDMTLREGKTVLEWVRSNPPEN